jgi:hypothetical protein
MKDILEVNGESAFAQVEPGVTFFTKPFTKCSSSMCAYSTALGDSEKPLSTLRDLQSLRIIEARRRIDHLAQAMPFWHSSLRTGLPEIEILKSRFHIFLALLRLVVLIVRLSDVAHSTAIRSPVAMKAWIWNVTLLLLHDMESEVSILAK